MLEAYALSDKGCVRANNEDYCLIDKERGLYILADGMGGARAGEQASRMAVETVAETVRSAGQPDAQVLIKATEEANRRVLEAAQNDSSLEGMGTTLTALLWVHQQLGLVHIGDSRAYLLRDGNFQQVTHDHTFVQTLVDQGRITPDELSDKIDEVRARKRAEAGG